METEAASSSAAPAGTALPEVCEKDGIEVGPSERDVLAGVVPAFAKTLKDPAARERYAELDRAAQGGLVPTHLVPSLEALLELVLQARRVRQQHGSEAEHVLSDLFYRTPRGAGLRGAARDATRALEALRGQTLEKLTVMAGPGRHTLLVETDRCRLTLKLDGTGALVEKVEVGG